MCHSQALMNRKGERMFELVKNRRSNGLKDNNLAHLHKMIANEKIGDNNDMKSSFVTKIKSPQRIFNNLKLIPLNEETAQIILQRSRDISSVCLSSEKQKNKSSMQS